MIGTHQEILYLSHENPFRLAEAIGEQINGEDFVDMAPPAPWFGDGRHHVILYLTVADRDANDTPKGKGWR
jgi:hypothetical protein